jgi:dsDNA-specific endonuclease/ATPase MutS2
MAEEDATQKIKDTLKEWIALDDEERQLRNQIKEIKNKKVANSGKILEFMRDNQVDNFALEGSGVGNISRSVRTSRPPLRRSLIRTQLLLQFSDQPQRVSEVLRAIEGIPEGAEDMSVGGTQKELLIRRIPREKKVVGITM